MKVFLGLHKTVDDRWEPSPRYIDEHDGIACQLDDGSTVVVVSDGRVLRFDADGRQVGERVPAAADSVSVAAEMGLDPAVPMTGDQHAEFDRRMRGRLARKAER